MLLVYTSTKDADVESDIQKLLHNCLYFTANSLARQISTMAEEEFSRTGLSPSHAFLLMLVNEQPGLTQKDLSLALSLAPSTVTRFVDSLSHKSGLVERRTKGKSARIYPTEKGAAMQDRIKRCWKSLYWRYSEILGEEEGRRLTETIDQAGGRLKG